MMAKAASSNIWPFALKNECEIANKVKLKGGTSAEEKFARVKHKTKLEFFHPFSCPVFVLDAVLQGGVSKIPQWDLRAQVGVYLGHSPRHAGNIALVLHLTTGHISP